MPPVQTNPAVHQSSCTMGTGSLPGVKRPGRGVDHPLTFSDEVEEIVELYLYDKDRYERQTDSDIQIGAELVSVYRVYWTSELAPDRETDKI